MKIYDKVKLINLKNEYEKVGLKLGDTGIVMGEEKDGYVLVYFDGNIYQDKDDVYKTTEIDAGILIDDLETINQLVQFSFGRLNQCKRKANTRLSFFCLLNLTFIN